MDYRIVNLEEKRLIGLRMPMSFAVNKTLELWRSFSPRKKEITNRVGEDLYSVQMYNQGFFDHFNPAASFDKWAAVEVSDDSAIPSGMESLVLASGLYVVFHYKGSSANAAEVFQYIFGEWLPASEYMLDLRHHFEILGEKYKNNDPDSEEELWIPIRLKK